MLYFFENGPLILMMNNNFHIYITTFNEEYLISYTIEALLKVFQPEQVSVIDLGSEDNTLKRIPKNIDIIPKSLPDGCKAGQVFTNMKIKYSKRQDWVLWVDGDEIYPTFSLLRIKEWLDSAERNEHKEKALRLYWKVLQDSFCGISCSREYLSAGPKLFNSHFFSFKRAWPREVIYPCYPNITSVKHKKEFNGVWFWHGVLLNRSSIEQTARRKKREIKENRYNQLLTFERIKDYPWNLQYEAEIVPEWAVVNMSENSDGLSAKWEGVL